MAERRTSRATIPRDAISEAVAEAINGTRADRIRIGRLLVERKTGTQWFLGDLAIAECGPARGIEDHNGRGGRLREYADEIGEDYDDLRHYRLVATAWEIGSREPIVPWTCYRQIYTHEPGACRARDCATSHGPANAGKTRFQIMDEYVAYEAAEGKRPSYRRFQAFLGIPVTPEITEANRVPEVMRGLQEMPAADREHIVSTVVAADTGAATAAFHTIAQQREDVVQEAMATNPQTGRAVNRAWNQHTEEVARTSRERTEAIVRENPGLRSYDERYAITELQEAVENMRRIATHITNDILPRAGALPAPESDRMGQRTWLRSALVDCYTALEPIRVLVTTGRTDLDAFLADVLGQRST